MPRRVMCWQPCLAIIVLASVAAAQDKDAISGTILSVETKGKTATLSVRTDTSTVTFPVTPKVDLEITSIGDDGFLAPGLMVRVDAIESNNSFFGSGFQVFPQHIGKVPPLSSVKAPPEVGQSQSRQFITGEIVKYTPDTEADSKYDKLELKGGPRGTVTIYCERARSITVIATDPAKLEAGQKIKMTGRTAGTKFIPSKLVVETGEELKAEEVLEGLRPAKKGKK